MASANCSYTLEQVISLIDSENNDESSDSEFDSDGSDENVDITKILLIDEDVLFVHTRNQQMVSIKVLRQRHIAVSVRGTCAKTIVLLPIIQNPSIEQ